MSFVPHIKYQSEQYIKCDDTSPRKYHLYFLPDLLKSGGHTRTIELVLYSRFILTFGQTVNCMQVLSLSAEVLLQCRAPTVPEPPCNPGLRVSGTYFNCIMFMVASSVVTTIMILNYHHRQADTHEMPSWVSSSSSRALSRSKYTRSYSGFVIIPSAVCLYLSELFSSIKFWK